MLKEAGRWKCRNGQAVYGSHALTLPVQHRLGCWTGILNGGEHLKERIGQNKIRLTTIHLLKTP
jgi:hypothetical protein